MQTGTFIAANNDYAAYPTHAVANPCLLIEAKAIIPATKLTHLPQLSRREML